MILAAEPDLTQHVKFEILNKDKDAVLGIFCESQNRLRPKCCLNFSLGGDDGSGGDDRSRW